LLIARFSQFDPKSERLAASIFRPDFSQSGHR
jgi:hypothetical protein